MLTKRKLRAILHYNPETGVLTWLVQQAQRTVVGTRAGFEMKNGYRRVSVEGRKYLEHRLVWFYMKGRWPSREIDHRNRVRNDNRWRNLREANDTEQRGNCRLHKNNKSGSRGVHWHAASQRWRAKLAGKTLGYFTNIEDAKAAYDAAACKRYGRHYHSP